MTIQVFGVTTDSVRKHWFPSSESFSTDTSPSAATVDEFITEEGATLAGRLGLESISVDSILAGTPAYAQLAKQLRLMVAVRTIGVMSGQNPDIAKLWEDRARQWLKSLSEGGDTFLGNPSIVTALSQSDGPNTHITEYGLSSGKTSYASSVEPYLRRDDQL